MPESKVWSVKVGHTASACLPRFLWHSSYTIGCVRSDWLRGWLCVFQPGGWQAEMRISPDCCISQSVRPQFLASVCLDEHHRNNKKMQGCQSSTKMCLFSCWCIFFHPFCWQQSLRLVSCIIRGFCLLSNAEMEDRRGWLGKKTRGSWVLVGEGGKSLMLWSFMEANNTLWYFISHLCSKKKKKSVHKQTTQIHTQSAHTLCQRWGLNYHPAERFAIFVLHAAHFLEVPIFQRNDEWMYVLFDFLRKIN